MKTIKLKELTIANFKGIASGSWKFEQNTDIVADVMQGKSTIKLAYLFALGIDIDNFFPLDKNNNYIGDLETKVALKIESNGIDYVLSRGAKIKYKIDRENDTKVFDGFKKDIFEFDLIPCTATEYKNKIVDLYGVDNFDTLKSLSILNYFNESLGWKERRELIYSLFVDKSTIECLKDKEEYNLIRNELLKGKTTSDISTMLNAETRLINENKTKNEILIADTRNTLNLYPNIDYNSLQEQISNIEKEINEETIKNSKLSSIDKSIEYENEIISLQNEKLKLERQDNSKYNILLNDLTILENQANNLKKNAVDIEFNISSKTEEFKKLKVLEFDKSKEICPYCKQALKQADIDTKIKEWENDKEKDLNALKSEILSLKSQIETKREEYSNLLYKISVKKAEIEKFEKNKEIAKIDSKILELKESLESLSKLKVDTSRVNELTQKRNELISQLGLKTTYENTKTKLQNLIIEGKQLVNNEIELVSKKEQLEKYKLEIISIVNDSINSKFNGVKFKLFDILTATAKSDIKETLVVLNGGVDYNAQSTGQKCETNLIIVSTIQEKLGVNLPIFIDDASITNIKNLPTNQTIMLYNEKGKQLNCIKIKDLY